MARTKHTILPERAEYFVAAVSSLKARAGSATIHELEEDVANNLRLSEAARAIPHQGRKKSHRTQFQYELAWVRQYLKWGGAIENRERGVWHLTPSGFAMSDDELRGLWKRIVAEQRERRKFKSETKSEEQLPLNELADTPRTHKETVLGRLTEVASPQASIASDGRLDAGPNPTFDVPTADDDLPGLPIRQRALIKVILSDLPRNAPKHLASCLRSYDDELKARGVQPILGLLKDMADIVAAAVAAPNADAEWLEPGVRQAFRRFSENHASFIEHFPLDPEREELYAQTPVDESHAVGRLLTEPFEAVAKVSAEAHEAGQVTPDYLSVIDKMTEFARVLSTQPPSSNAPTVTRQERSAHSNEIKVTRRIASIRLARRSERSWGHSGSSNAPTTSWVRRRPSLVATQASLRRP
jgi:hypothetical protein